MSELPNSWVTADFEKVLNRIVGGGTPSKANAFFFKGKIPFMTVKDMKERFPSDTVDHISDEAIEASATTVVPEDTLIVATRMSLGKVVRPRFETAINQDLKALFLADGINKTFIEHWWRSQSSLIQSLGTGTTVKGIRLEDIRALSIDIPPAPEQKRIADKLDAVLARVDACRDRLDRIPAILKRFRQSVLAAATSGKLTEDWRSTNVDTGTGLEVIAFDAKAKAAMLKKDESLSKKKSSAYSDVDESYTFELPESWAFTSWGKISEWITYGFTRPMPSTSEGMKLVTAKDVLNFVIRLDSAGYTTTEGFSGLSDKDRPQRGDLLITKDGTIGRAAIVNSDEPFCINQSVAVCWLRSTSMNKRYLELIANTEFTQRFVFEKSKGMAIQHLSIIDFAQCPVPVPPLQEQDEIVRRVDFLFSYADRIEARHTAARAQVEKLTPATLAKAFRGELVPQDPNDEPASVLLERIQAARAAVIGTGSPKRRKVSEKAVRKFKAEVIMLELSRIKSDHLKSILKEQGKLAPKVLWQASQLSIEDFYEQLRTEEAKRLLREVREGNDIFLEAA